MGLPLAAAVKALAAKVSILEPAKLDMVEARAQALLSKVHDISDRSANASLHKENAKV
jgi:hypothetical protein